MEANAQDPKGAQSLADALGQHSPALVQGGVNLDEVDTNDGEKIVGNVFGEQQGEVVNRLGAVGGTGGQGLVAKLLPMLAPIVLSYLASRMGGGGGQDLRRGRRRHGGPPRRAAGRRARRAAARRAAAAAEASATSSAACSAAGAAERRAARGQSPRALKWQVSVTRPDGVTTV